MSDSPLPLSMPLGYGSLPRMLEPIPARVVAPVAEPLTVEQAKQHLRVEFENTDDDTYIGDLIAVARDEVERHMRRALYRQQWQLTLDRFPPVIRLPVPPHMAVESVTYVDEDETEQTLDPTSYRVDVASGAIVPAFACVWPPTQRVPGAVKVLWWSGYTDGIVLTNPPPGYTPPAGQLDPRLPQGGDPLKLIPPAAKHAIRLLLGHWYENRE